MFKWKFPNPFGRKSRKGITKKIVLGICAMDKKTKSKPMREILDRLPRDLFEIRIFGDECILNEPVESWPVVEVLITFYSTKFPTDKALEYIKLRKPFLINDLSMESTLQDRRKVYNLLEQCGIDVPRHVFVSRDENGDTYDIEEFDEYIMINGEQLNKPFVEKPVYAEDHNIYIYYPISAGGGSKRLFRKVEDKSAEFYPHINEIRREGSYIYEEFVTTQGTDVKVYTVGAEYGHAEARKSPVVDGRVKRDSEGREVRYPVILSPIEKEMARKIVQAFRQTVCGFDILRVQGKSYCCDVNGFSFVKNSRKYYEDAAQILTEIMLNNLRQEYQLPPSIQTKRVPSPALSQTHPSSSKVIRTRDTSMSVTAMDNVYVPTVVTDEANSSVHGGNRPPSPSPSIVSEFEYANPTLYSANQRRYETEELRSVIAIIRHGDRTPKQKIKVVISEQLYLDYFHSYVKTPKKDLKVKSKSGLVKFLEVTRDIIQDRNTANELRRKLIQLRDVLERWEISGINRKLQMKPQKWDEDEIVETEEWVDLPDDGESDVDLLEGNRSTLVLSREASTSVIPVVDTRLSSSELAAPKAAATGTDGAPDTTEVDVTAPVNGTEIGQERVSTPSPIVPIGEDATSVLGTTSTATPTRRRQLVKTKKVVREGTGLATEILVILKWGGDLTPLGREQAEKLGERFRNENYPDHDNGGVLRLHATYRHDLKIKASDEGRVMKTAAAFTKGLLELEGQLTPILASLVTIEEKNRTMLDRGGNFEMKEEMDRCKKHLNLLQVDQDVTDELIEQIVPGCSETTRRAFHDLGNPLEKLRRMHYLIDKICTQLEFLCIRREESGLGVDDSLVMTDYILPASNSTTAVSAPSPIALNMVGINLPEPVAAAPASATVAATAGTSDSSVGEDASAVAVVDGATTTLAAEGTTPPSGIPPLQVTLPGTDTSGAIAAGEATASVPTTAAPPSTSVVSPEPEDLSFMNTLYLNETFDLMLERWKKLHKDFYSSKTNQYDLTKLPDVYDMIRYDVLHNQHLNFTGMDELYALAKLFEVVVVPQEYGIDAADKRYIGSKMCGALLEKIKHDLTIASGVDSGLNGQDPMLFQLDHSHAEDLRINSIGRVVRTRLYFTSESHLHTILNVFRYPKPNSPFAFGKEAMDKLEEITNVSYLSQIVIRLFEDRIERGKFSCEVSFSSGSMQHDPVVMSTTTLPLDSPYLLGPYIYLDRSLNLYQLLGCLDDAIELYHNTDKHTTNAMLLAASGQMSVNRLTPLPSEDVGDGLGVVDGSDGTLKVHPDGQETDGEEHDALAHGTGTAADGQLRDACCCVADDIAGDTGVSATAGDAGDTGSVAVGEGFGSCVTPPPSTNASSSLSRQSSVKRSNTVPTTTTTSSKHTTPMQASTGVSSGSSKRPPMSASSVHGQRRLVDDDHEVVDADPDPVIDSVHSSPVRQSLTRSGGSKKASGYDFGTDADDHAGQATRPAFASRHSSKAWKPAKLDDLSSPSPMRRNYSVTVNIDEASDNWERLEKTLFTLHPMHHSHPPQTASAMSAGVAAGAGAGDGSMGGGLSGSATSISRSRQQELDLLTRRAIAAQLHQQQQQQLQMHSVFQGSPSTFTASTTTAAAGATAGSGDSSTTTTPLRVPAKRAVSLGSSEVLSTSAANAFVAPPSLPSAAGASAETVAAADAPPVSTDAASSVAPFSAAPPQNDSPVAPAIVAEAPAAPSSDVPPPPPPPITTTSPSQLMTASTSFSNPASSRKRTGSLSADNIVLLDRDRATSDLGLVSESRVLAATPTAAAAAGVLIVDSSASVAGGNGTVTVVKASPVTVDTSSSQLSVAVPASPHQRPSTSSQQSAGDYDLQLMSEATTPGTGVTGATNAATDAGAPGVVTTTSTTNGDVIVVQRSLSDIENRRLKDSLYLASDFYVPPSPPPASASASGPTADSNSTQQPR